MSAKLFTVTRCKTVSVQETATVLAEDWEEAEDLANKSKFHSGPHAADKVVSGDWEWDGDEPEEFDQ